MSGQHGLAKVLLLASAAAIVIAPASASAADHILSGSVASASGEKLGGATVSAKVIGHGRADKIRIVKFRRRKHHRKQMGHRQHYTEIQITGIAGGKK